MLISTGFGRKLNSQKRFYNRKTTRGLRISRLTEISDKKYSLPIETHTTQIKSSTYIFLPNLIFLKIFVKTNKIPIRFGTALNHKNKSIVRNPPFPPLT